MEKLDIIDKIEACKKNSFFLKDLSNEKTSNSEGIILMFVENKNDVYFEKCSDKEKGVDTYLLNEFMERTKDNILYIKYEKNIRQGIKKFQKNISKCSRKPEIIFNQIKNKDIVKIGYITTPIGKYCSGTEVEEYLKEFRRKPVMNSIFKSNDATPSWNGFNYQGFVTILRVMELLNKVSEENRKNYAVEIEKYEDFIIYENNKPKEIFQVKAYVAEKRTTSYIEACEKLINHKKQVGSRSAKCYLATASDISDWKNYEYAKNIALYGYKTGKHIGTEDIVNHIKEEIKLFFSSIDEDKEYNDLEIDLAFANISYLVIDKINYLHNNRGSEDNEYKITFMDFSNKLKETVNDMEVYNLFFARLKLDGKVLMNFDNQILFYCKDCDKPSCEYCPLKDLRETFEAIDRPIYAKVLDPTVTEDDTNAFITEVFSGARIEEILEILESVDTEILFSDKKHIYIANNRNIDDYLEKVIPSSINLKRKSSLPRVLSGVKENNEVKKIYANSSVIVNMKEEKVVYKEQKVNIIPGSLFDDKEIEAKKSIFPDVNFNFIKRDTFIERNKKDE
ncbi:hypothetical protein [Vagococcus salmoninarum]|uniref:hypothetical protein n=1 Tax=Vagococcus salmoninarum TaxID=2739 RepID=UPI00188177A7|nr:hypothetical protein [Vagococcus salmoninarum]MBE9387801.1 hypothetical protein [Vagococcus salmoninarum]